MAAEVDGDRLTPQEFGSFFILLVVAGNETTRNTISHGVKRSAIIRSSASDGSTTSTPTRGRRWRRSCGGRRR